MTFAQIRALHVKSDGLAGDFSCEKRAHAATSSSRPASAGRMVLVDANKTDRVDLLVQAIHDANALDWAIFDTSSTDKIDQALLLEPKLMILPRVGAAADAPGILANYKDHLPVIVEIDSAIFPASADVVHAAGTRAFTDVFGTDLSVKFGGIRTGTWSRTGRARTSCRAICPMWC